MNPFPSNFDGTCEGCGNEVSAGDTMFALDGRFVCESCAEEEGRVCDCGNVRKEEFDQCYECYEANKKPMKTKFDLKTVYHKDRPLSWSAISSFEWSPSQWHARYVLKEPSPTSPEMTFGKEVGERLASDPLYLPQVPRYPEFEHELRAVCEGIPLIGYIDSYNGGSKIFEYKTGRKEWNKKRADAHGQIDMYLLILNLRDKLLPDQMEAQIHWLPTHIHKGKVTFIDETDVQSFKTKRSMLQILRFRQRIKDTWVAMEEYASRQVDVVSHVKVKRPVSRLLK